MKKYNCPDCTIVCDNCDGCPRIPKNILKEINSAEKNSIEESYGNLCPVNGTHEWEYNHEVDTIGRVFICKHCGQRKHIPYEPYPYYNYNTTSTDAIPPACRNCPNHPLNGGSGICHCILGQRPVYC